MRDRLIELIADEPNSVDNIVAHADYLLANGVIVTPCKVGDTVYEVVWLKGKKFSHLRECKVAGYHMGEFPDLRGHKRNNYLIVYYECGCLGHIPYDKIGKTVFLTREDAEKALKGGEG